MNGHEKIEYHKDYTLISIGNVFINGVLYAIMLKYCTLVPQYYTLNFKFYAGILAT